MNTIPSRSFTPVPVVIDAPAGWAALDGSATGLIPEAGRAAGVAVEIRPLTALVRASSPEVWRAGSTAVLALADAGGRVEGAALAAGIVEATVTADGVDRVARVQSLELPAGPAVRVTRRRHVADTLTGAVLTVVEVTFVVAGPGRSGVAVLTCSTTPAAFDRGSARRFQELARSLRWSAPATLGACA